MAFRFVFVLALLVAVGSARAEKCGYEANSFVSRVVAVESAGGRIFGPATSGASGGAAPAPFALNDKEIVLVFTGGPHGAYTGYILDILDKNCAKATFFFDGGAALAHAKSVRDAAQRGHTLGAAVAPGKGGPGEPLFEVKAERAFSAITKGSASPIAPFVRLGSAGSANLPADASAHMKARGLVLWFPDVAASDGGGGAVTSYTNRMLEKIQGLKKGMIEFRDTSRVTVDALESILQGLKAQGFKVVHIVAHTQLAPKEEASATTEDAAVKPGPSLAGRRAGTARRSGRRPPVLRAGAVGEADREEDAER